MKMMATQSRGFTLTEMMITVVIIGILAAIALPLYQRYIENTNLRGAQSAMLDVANKAKIEQARSPNFWRNVTTVQINANNITLNNLNVSVDPSVTKHYALEGSLIKRKGISGGFNSGNTEITTGFRLVAVPINSTYTKAAWIDSSGAAYTCVSAAAARLFDTSGDCVQMTK